MRSRTADSAEATGEPMTGPEHYIAAEALLVDARHVQDKDDVTRVLATAQVHATLALAAAAGVHDSGVVP
jgi:hypothetical protein